MWDIFNGLCWIKPIVRYSPKHRCSLSIETNLCSKGSPNSTEVFKWALWVDVLIFLFLRYYTWLVEDSGPLVVYDMQYISGFKIKFCSFTLEKATYGTISTLSSTCRQNFPRNQFIRYFLLSIWSCNWLLVIKMDGMSVKSRVENDEKSGWPEVGQKWSWKTKMFQT